MRTLALSGLALGLAMAVWAAEVPVAGLIRALGAEPFAERQAAERQLVALAERGHEALLQECVAGYRQSADPEVRFRLKSVIEQVVEKYLFAGPRGFLGIQINNLIVGEGGRVVINGTEVPARAIWISNVVEGSGAAKAGLLPNDIIVAVNGQHWPGEGTPGFIRHIQTMKPGTVVRLSVVRANQTNELTATLGDLPEAERERLNENQRWLDYFADWWKQHLGEALPVER